MDWDRVFLTVEHLNHERRFSWRSNKPGSTFCLICAVDILANVNRLAVEKKHVLVEFLNQLTTNRAEVADAINGTLPYSRRAIYALIDLIQHHDEQLTTYAAEGALQLLDVIISPEVTEHILENIIVRICEVRDHQLHSKTLDLLSQLVRRQPYVAQHYVTVAGGRFLGFLNSALVHAADDIKNSAVFMLVLLVRELGWVKTFDPLIDSLPDDVIDMLRNTSNKDLQMNGLHLVQLMTYHPTAAEALLAANIDGATLPDILKKTLLTRDQRLLQAAVHCVATLLKCPEVPFATLMLRNDLPNFLFENLGSVDDVLIGSILCCCVIFTESDKFFTECYSVYGIDSILRATEFALDLQHFPCLDLAFQLLNIIFAKQPKNRPLFNNFPKVLQVLLILKRGIETSFGTVALSAIRTFSAFLRRDHLLCPVPFLAIQETVKRTLESICELTNVGHKLALPHFEEQLAAVILCVNSLQRLCQDCVEDPTCLGSNYEVCESSENELDNLQFFVAKICDEILIPLILANKDSLTNLEVFNQFLDCLVLLLDTQNSAWAKDNVTKVVSCGFLNLACESYSVFQQDMRVERKNIYFEIRNVFVSKYLCYLIALDWNFTKDEQRAMLVQLQNGVVHLQGLPRHFLDVFVRDCDSAGNGSSQEAAQATLLALCNFVALYDQSLISSEILLPALCHLAIMRQLHLDIINLKYVLFLIAVSSVRWTESQRDIKASIPNYKEAVQVLLSEIQRLKSTCCIYTHHRAFLKWVFSSEDVGKVIGKTTLQCCLQYSRSDRRGLRHFDLGVVMAELLDHCDYFANFFMDCLSDQDLSMVNIATKALESLKYEVNSRALVLKKIPKILAANLTMNGDSSLAGMSDENVKILLRWLAGYLITTKAESSSLDSDASDGHLPLFHQVTKVANWAFSRSEYTIFSTALQCLNFLLEKFHSAQDPRGVSLLLLDTNFLSTVEEFLNQEVAEESSHSNLDALMILAILIRSQEKFELKVIVKFCKRIVLEFSVVHQALFSSFEPSILISLQICADFIRCINSLSVFFGLKNITEIPNFSEETSGETTYNDGFALLDLSALYAVLLNLLFKEFQNDKVQAIIFECLQAVILMANRIDEIEGGRMISHYWTGMAVEMMLPNMDGNAAILQFIHSVLYFSPSTSTDDIWIEIWEQNFQAIIKQFDEAIQNPTSEVKLKLQLLHQISAFAMAIPNLKVDRKLLEELIVEFEKFE